MANMKSLIPGFSLKRATGITSAKQKIAKATGIPTTKAGRKKELERTVSKLTGLDSITKKIK